MSSSRRSQKLSLENSLIFSSISSTKKSSDKVKADAARKVKADVAARIIVKIVVKVNIADVAVKVNCFHNFKRQIIDSFKTAKKACKMSNKKSSIYKTSFDLNKIEIEIYVTYFQFSFQRFDIHFKYIIINVMLEMLS